MVKFELVNPIIHGTFSVVYEADTPLVAAKMFWENLTVDNHFVTNNIPLFAFTLRKSDTDDLYDFTVSEEVNEEKQVIPKIQQIDVPYTEDEKKKFIEAFEKAKNEAIETEKSKENKSKEADLEMEKDTSPSDKKGGRRKRYEESKDDDSSSDSDSDSDVETYLENNYLKYLRARNKLYPINYFWYYPGYYKLNNLFMLTFPRPITPYVHLYVPAHL